VALSNLKNSDPHDTAHPLRLEARYLPEPGASAEPARPSAGRKSEPLVTPNWLVPLFPGPHRQEKASRPLRIESAIMV